MLEYANIMLHIEQTYSIKKGTLNKYNKSQTMSEARAVAQFLMRDCCGLSYNEIGVLFNRAHVSVMSSCEKIERMLKEENSRVCYAVYTYLNNREKYSYTKCDLNNKKAKKRIVAKNATIADRTVANKLVKEVNVEKCFSLIEEIYGFKKGDLVKANSSKEFINEARKISFYLLNTHCSKTLKEIANIFGFKCHSYCSHSNKEIREKLRQGDNEVCYVVNKFNVMLGLKNGN